jgi:hypothetical protein
VQAVGLRSVLTWMQGNVRLRRIFLLAAYPGEGRFTEPTADAQRGRGELVFMPLI